MVKKWFITGQKLIRYQNTNIVSAAFIITLMSGVSAILGLWRNRMLIARFFGDTTTQLQLDAYWVAFRLPELVFQLLVIGALSAAFIPVFTKQLKKDREEAFAMASSMMNLVLGFFILFSVAIFIWAEPMIHLITSVNFSPEQVRLAAQLWSIMMVAQLFFAVSNFLTGMIQAHQRFLIPAIAPVMYNLGIMAGILFLTPYLGIYGAAIGVVLGALLHLLLQWPIARSLGFKYQLSINTHYGGVKEMITLMPPRAMAIGVHQLEPFASVFFATALSSGSLTILNIAQQLMSAPVRIISVPLGQASLPFLSKEAHEEGLNEFKSVFAQSLNQILFLTLPAGMLLLILRIPLVRLAYGAAEFPWAATLMTGRVVALLSISLFSQGALHLVTRAFYALHNTRTPFTVALFAVLINVGLSSFFVFILGWDVRALAIAMSLANIGHFLVLLTLLHKEAKGLPIKDILQSLMKMIWSTALMGVALWVPMRLLDQYVFDTTRVVPLVLLTLTVSIIGMGVYFVLAYWQKMPELMTYTRMIRKLGNWQQVLTKSEEVLEPAPTQGQEIKPLS